MSRARGLALALAFARYLQAWWPLAEAAAPGRPGTDVTNTPGVVWEVKTSREWRPEKWVEQARHHVRQPGRALSVLVYFPPGIAARRLGSGMAILRVSDFMPLLEEAGYTPEQGAGEQKSG